MAQAPRDQNYIPTALFESSTNPGTTISGKIDEITGRVLVDNSGGGTGTVTSIATAGLISGGTITTTGTITTSIATNKLVGRGSAGTGVFEAITLGTNLSLSGTTLNATGGGGTPGGSDTQVQFNNSGSFGGDANFTWDDVNKNLIILDSDDSRSISIDGDAVSSSGVLFLNGTSVGLTNTTDGSGHFASFSTASMTADRAFTFPDAAGTFVLNDNTATLTHKTYDTAGAGNSFSINGVAVTANTGTGAVVRATSPTIATASLGSSTATTQTPSDNSTKLATTAYVDAAVLGQNFKEAAVVATTANLVGIYLNGSSGVGATFTYTATGVDTIDGVALALGNRVLLKNQTSTFQNGIYTVTTAGALAVAGILTRATDANQSSEYKTGDSIFVTSGTTQSATTWAYTGGDSPVMGTDPITYAQTAGQGSFTSGNGITITGNSIAIDTSVTVDKTTAQTLTNKTLTAPVLTTPALGTPASGVMTNVTGLPAAAVLAGTLGTGAYVMDTKLTVPQIINTANTVTVTSNAGTVPITSKINNFTNSSASAMTITLATASAVDGQICIVRTYDFSGVAEGITWVNTENSSVTPSATSNGSTTLPRTDGFQFNGATSKWRCLASA